jgi:hypothetical protein
MRSVVGVPAARHWRTSRQWHPSIRPRRTSRQWHPSIRIKRASRQWHPNGARRAAFTLLEVLLALGLGVVLLTAVYAALHLHWQYSTAGRVDVERSQLARALLERMTLDIRCVIFQEPALGDDLDDLGAEGGFSMGMTTLIDAAGSGEALGVFGDSQTLMLHVSRVVRGLDYAPFDGEGIVSRTSDLKSVSYFLAGAGGGVLQEAVAGLMLDDGTVRSRNEPGQGLVRIEGDLLALDQADQMGDVQALASGAQLLASEVTFLQFRYFDGFEWLDMWDSTLFGALPRAIEIVIGFQPWDDDLVALPGQPASESTEIYRLVVALPLAQTMMGEANL